MLHTLTLTDSAPKSEPAVDDFEREPELELDTSDELELTELTDDEEEPTDQQQEPNVGPGVAHVDEDTSHAEFLAMLLEAGLEHHFETLVENIFDCAVCALAEEDDWKEIGISPADASKMRRAGQLR